MGFVDNDLIELDGSVHSSDIGVVTKGRQDAINKLLNNG